MFEKNRRATLVTAPPNNEGTLRSKSYSSKVTRKSADVRATCVDLFAGAGGFSLGALSAGCDVVGALELHEAAASTYGDNIRRPSGARVPFINDDILSVTPEAAMSKWQLVPGQCEILVGGPPCQGFSSHRIRDSGVGDPRNELLCRYFDYVAALRPKFFLVENVPGLLWPRHKEYLTRFFQMANEAEYEVFPPVILNAKDFGVPQNRRRVFILGRDRRAPLPVSWPPLPTHVDPQTPLEERNGRPTWQSAQEVFRRAPAGDPNNVHMRHSDAMVELFEQTPINGGSRRDAGRVLKCHENYNGHSDVYGRIDPRKPGPTMTTACINPSKGRFVHPTQHHGITVRQAARFQTFPDDFVFSGGLMASGAQVGNAVPVKLAEAVLRPLIAALVDNRS